MVSGNFIRTVAQPTGFARLCLTQEEIAICEFFWLAPVLYAVKDIYNPISWQVMTKTPEK
jgi:hypothetical protein